MSAQSSRVSARGADAATVLIVDDNDDLRFLLRRLFDAHEAFEVAGEAADGRQALEQAVRLQPDVIILDLMMPELDGRAALPQLVRDCPETMILVLSVLDAGEVEEAVLGRGAFAFHEKHRVTARLAEVTAEHLDQFRSALEGEDTPPAWQLRRD